MMAKKIIKHMVPGKAGKCSTSLLLLEILFEIIPSNNCKAGYISKSTE